VAGLSLWDWAGRAYAAPGVEALCLDLQDRGGQSVCLLLWAGWAAVGGRAPSAGTLAEAAGLARAWEGQVVQPMRAARRALKIVPGLAEDERERLRDQVKAAELAAERALLAALETLAPAGGDHPSDPAAALAAACLAWGAAAPPEALNTLAAAFPRA
jgi:uncharacterized protein (TIGR02444 family)